MAAGSAQRRRGGAIVFTVIVLFVLIGFVGLAVDWGYMTWTAQKLQNAADAAALAGAQQVWSSHSQARSAAINLARLNEAGGKIVALRDNPDNAPDGDIVIGTYNREAGTFTVTDDKDVANAVRVVARRTSGSAQGPLPLFFGPIFEKNSAEVARYGIAVAIGGPQDDSIIALNDKDKNSLYVYGNPTVDLGYGSVQVNSSSAQGTLFQGTNFDFIAGEVNMVGDYYERGNSQVENSTDLNQGEDYESDPLASLPPPIFPEPVAPPSQITGTSDGIQRTFQPGYYKSGLRMNAGDNVLLYPGVYILSNEGNSDGAAFFTNGHCKLTGYGVMFYIYRGSVDHNGTGDVHLTPMTAEQSLELTGVEEYGTYEVQFFQARDNTSTAFFRGSGLFTGESASTQEGSGTMYFPKATLKVGGTADMYIRSLIADKIEIFGDGTKYITYGYDGNHGGDKVYLVE